MVKIVGIENVSYNFVGKDGNPVQTDGVAVYYGFPINPTKGDGVKGVKRCYISYAKICRLGIEGLTVGVECELFFDQDGRLVDFATNS